MPKRNRIATRYGWIEASLRYSGWFDKKCYGAYFDINSPQISNDQLEFIQAFNTEVRFWDRSEGRIEEDVLCLDKGKISVLKPMPERHVFDIPDFKSWMKTLSYLPYIDEDALTKQPQPDVVANLMISMRSGKDITIRLDDGDHFTFSPKAIAERQGCLFIRGVDQSSREMRDVNVSQVSLVSESDLQDEPSF